MNCSTLADIRIGSWVRIIPTAPRLEEPISLVGRMARVEDIWGYRNDQLMVWIPDLGVRSINIFSTLLCHGDGKREVIG